jgi:hypothetical protein
LATVHRSLLRFPKRCHSKCHSPRASSEFVRSANLRESPRRHCCLLYRRTPRRKPQLGVGISAESMSTSLGREPCSSLRPNCSLIAVKIVGLDGSDCPAC